MDNITSFPVKNLSAEQLEKFTYDSIHTQEIFSFDPEDATKLLLQKEGTKVIGADFGGDKGVSKLFIVRDGCLQPSTDHDTYVQGALGDGYLDSFEEIARFASAEKIPVGISWGAPLEGTKPLYHPKMVNFLDELSEKYDGDLAEVLPSMTACINDGPAGLISGAVEAYRVFKSSEVLFPINGGGLGMAVLKDNKIFSTEAGHVEGVKGLNQYNQTKPCGVFGANYVCIETLGANKAGIEAQWEQEKGQYMRAIDIETLYKEGDEFAGELYENSAFVVAHMIAGTAQALDIDLTSKDAVIVAHGGGFKFPHYGERVAQILKNEYGENINLLMTHDYIPKGSNACLEGAAIAALIQS